MFDDHRMLPAPEGSWSHPGPPLPPVVVDPAASGVEVRMRAERDRRGVVTAPHALIRREAGGRQEPAAIVAWARPRGTTGWPWVLVTWMDQYGGSRTMSTRVAWRAGWLAYDPLLLEGASQEPRGSTEYWREQRAAAIVATVEAAGLDR